MEKPRGSLPNRAIVVDGHNHFMRTVVKRRKRGEKAVFSKLLAPVTRKAGINVLVTVIGGDNTTLTDNCDLMLWGSLRILDILWEEAEESGDTIMVCLNSNDIEAALQKNKIAILLQMEGGRSLEGKPNLDTLVGLRTFYRQGLRVLQLTGNGRNRIADGAGEARTKGGLTNFGISVVQEMNRLGMLIDVAHLSEAGFWDVIEASKDPIINSHSNARALCDHIRNLTDQQIKAIAEKGGVVGLTVWAPLISSKNEKPTIDELMRHVDHIVDLVGIDHVGFGLDLDDGVEEEKNQDAQALLADIFNPPGYIEGVYYGGAAPQRMPGAHSISVMPLFKEALIKRGYSEMDVNKILGNNFLRVFRKVIR